VTPWQTVWARHSYFDWPSASFHIKINDNNNYQGTKDYGSQHVTSPTMHKLSNFNAK